MTGSVLSSDASKGKSNGSLHSTGDLGNVALRSMVEKGNFMWREICWCVGSVLIAHIILFGHGNAQTEAQKPSGPPRALHDYPVGKLEIDSDGQAKAIVDKILSHFKLTASWKIWITDKDSETPYALARLQPDGTREIIFNKQFITKITEHDGMWPAYCVAAHEVAHHLKFHLENKPVRLKEFELEADTWCGFLLGKMNSDYAQAISALQFVGEATGYPTRSERIRQIGEGWKEATGKGVPDDEPKAAPTAFPTPRIMPQEVSNERQNFTLKENRDIFGHDIKLTQGQSGIPGMTLDECVRACDKRGACKAFSFDKWNGWCFLKDAIATSLIDPHSIIGVKKPQPLPNASKVAPEMTVLRGRRFRDKPILQSKVNDFNKCKAACAKEIRCVAFSYLKSENKLENCQFFNGSVGPYNDPTADSGYKEQNQSL
jgi:PAN domain